MFGVVSLTMGNSAFPFTHGLAGNAQLFAQLFLRQSGLLTYLCDPFG